MSSSRKNRRPVRRLGLEALESRRVLTVFNVDSLSDVTNPIDGVTTLREAITAANAEPTADFHEIRIVVPGTIHLTQGELTPTNTMFIVGFFDAEDATAQLRTTIDAGGSSGILSVTTNIDLGVQLVRLTGGNVAGSGGAVRLTAGAILVGFSWIDGNSATGTGGGIFASGESNVFIDSSTISNNFAAGEGGGGGIAAETAGLLSVVNSTISGNRTNGSGGGVLLGSGSATFTNSTVVLNQADSDSDFSGSGGGIAVGSGAAIVNNTIVAGNVSDGFARIPDDISGSVSGSNNIVSTSSGNPLTDGVSGNVVGGVQDDALDIESIVYPFLRRSGTYAPFHPLVPGSPALDGGNNSLAVDSNQETLKTDQRGLTRLRNGDALGVATVDIGAMEVAAPSLSVGGNVSFTENGSSTLLASAATITDPDSTRFGGAVLVVSITRNAQSGDTLTIRNQGNAAGQIGVSGRYIKHAGKTIGSFSGGTSDPLVIRLNSNATLGATQALLRNLSYRHVGENPSASPRTIAIAFEDGEGGVAFRRFKTLNVVPVNDAPKLSGSTTRSYTLNGAAVLLTPSATVTDVDSANFFSGTLRVAIVSGDSTANRLSIGGAFTRTGNDIFLGSVKIGTLTASGFGLNDLVIKFTSSATVSIVQQLTRAITFKTVNGTVKAQQLINFTLTDGDGGTSETIQVTLNVN